MKICFSCRKEIDLTTKPGRGDTCRWCGADIKVCRNCRYFDGQSYNECTEPQADRVLEKERSNYCEYFELADADQSGRAAEEDALKALKDLFK